MGDSPDHAVETRDVPARVAYQPLGAQRVKGYGMLGASLLLFFVVPLLVGNLWWVPLLLGAAGSLAAFAYLVSLARGPGERRFAAGHYRLVDGGFWAWQDSAVARTVTPDDVAAGWCEAGEAGPAVVLRLHDGSLLAVEPDDRSAVETLLQRAGLPPSARAERMRLGRDDPSGRMVAAFLLAPLLLVGLPTILGTVGGLVALLVAPAPWLLVTVPVSVLLSSLFAFLIGWLGAKLVPSWIRVGTDGVLVRKLLQSFIPYAELRGVRIDGGPVYFKVVLERAKGRPLRIAAASRDQASAVVDQVESDLEAFRSRRRAVLTDALDQGDRDPATWRRDLGQLLHDGGYRSQGVDRQQLLRVAEDPGLPERIRVAAAIALQPAAVPQERERVRVAAQASASPNVRVALEQAIDGELQDEALAALR